VKKSANVSCRFAIVDAYPVRDSSRFEESVGAIVSCWLREDLVGASLVQELASRLLVDSWTLGSILSEEQVTRATYGSKLEGRERYLQAAASGFATHGHVREREVITLGDDDEPGEDVATLARYLGFLRAVKAGGIYSLSHEAESQWANGVTPDGDDFLPIWATGKEAEEWSPQFDGARLHHVGAEDLLGDDGFLQKIAGSRMRIGMGVDQCLVMTHPLLLLDDLAPAPGSTPK
jgi:hypothetical protein